MAAAAAAGLKLPALRAAWTPVKLTAGLKLPVAAVMGTALWVASVAPAAVRAPMPPGAPACPAAGPAAAWAGANG